MTKLKLPLDTPILDSFAFLFLIVGFIPGLAVGLPIFVLVNQLLTWVVDEPVYLIVAVNIILELMAGYGVQNNRGSIATVELYFAYAVCGVRFCNRVSLMIVDKVFVWPHFWHLHLQ